MMQSNRRFSPAAVVMMAMVPGAIRAQSPPEAGWSDRVPRVAGARHHYAAADGQRDNPGTREAPWDLASAMAGGHTVAPGDVIWVRGGKYRGPIELKLAGKPEAPVHVRAYPGERVTILDGALSVAPPAGHVWVWDLEISTTMPAEKRIIRETGSHPNELPAWFGDGISISHAEGHVYRGLKFIDLAIHDTRQGISFWIDAVDSEVHGCLIYENGWKAPDRGHGHCIYAQNRDGVKTISNCIMSAKYDGAYTVHAYGSDRAYVDYFVVEDNIAYEIGPVLIGGGRPSHHIKALRNYLHGVSLRLGYGAPYNEDCEVRDNLIARGGLRIDRYRKVVQEGNSQALPERKAVVIPNRYDPDRAHLAVYNGAKAAEVAVDVSGFLRAGESFRLLNPRDVFGEPVLTGTCQGGTIAVPMHGEFAAFVLVKDRRRG